MEMTRTRWKVGHPKPSDSLLDVNLIHLHILTLLHLFVVRSKGLEMLCQCRLVDMLAVIRLADKVRNGLNHQAKKEQKGEQHHANRPEPEKEKGVPLEHYEYFVH
ncbi:hypothetical protein MLD38_035744 [Melastoma candidum]|uniref:Uncharacterized protein n=1 Tax=Melastoma candidum TaxID=119954 RepID=A0ACB9LHJ9_9MYRT|nr:hypothetical protein MLD38_035744 [Melastoma candidum]